MKTNWDHLRYFNALANHGTLTATARQLGVSHSTVQRRIAAFEDELRVQLFLHTGNGYKLTRAGETLYSETADIQRTLSSISSRLTGSDDELNGKVSITMSDTIGYFLLPTILRELCKQYPGIEFSVSVKNSLSDIRNLEADIAIRTGSKPPPDLIGRKVGKVSFAVCASTEYLAKHNLDARTALHGAHDYIRLVDNFRDAGFTNWIPDIDPEKNIVCVGGFLTAWRLCNSGIGLSLLPAYLLDHDSTLVEINGAAIPETNNLWVLSHSDLRDSVRVKAVRQHLTDKLRQTFDKPNKQ